MKNAGKMFCRVLALALSMAALLTVPAMGGTAEVDNTIPMLDVRELKAEWKQDQDFTLADPAPWNLEELKQVVDVQDPRSVAAYWVWAVTRLTDNYDDGMGMMKYLFADIEVFGRGFTEGGATGKAGWDSYFNERLKDTNYKWLPRAYFNGASSSNGFKPARPLTIELYYNNTNTETINAQTLDALGRLNIVYWVKSYAGSNKVNITLSKFEDSNRWYVTSGASSSALFFQQPGNNATKTTATDDSTAAEHEARYSGKQSAAEGEAPAQKALPFTDIPETGLYADAIRWAFENGITNGATENTFGTKDSCTRGQVVTFLWRAAGKPEPEDDSNPFRDVSEDAYYKPVLWAVWKGITGGTSEDTFSPDQPCSTAHIITFLYRAMGAGSNGWYEEARGWAAGKGLLEGTDITVSPDVTCPRGDVAAFLFRAYGR